MSSTLVELRKSSSVSAHAVGAVWVEMFRSEHLDRVQYMQQVAADGILKGSNKIDAEIIASMPTQSLPATVLNWRHHALMTICPDPHAPTSLGELKQAIATQTKAVKNGTSSGKLTKELEGRLEHLTPAETFDLSKWLHGSLLPFLGRKGEGTDVPFPCRFTQFVVILLEAINDYPQLHELLTALSQRSDPDGLKCIATSVEAQDEVFAALGYLSSIWQTLLHAYRTLRSASYGPHKDLCLLFLRTNNCDENARKYEQYLKNEISMCDTGIAACTPMSDMEVDTVEEGRNELDRILSNGPQLDTAQLSIALDKILAHIAVAKPSTGAQAETIRTNLVALKNANEENFMPLMTQCLQQQLSISDEHGASRILSTLLSSRSIDLAGLLDCVNRGEEKPAISQTQHREPVAALRCLRFFFTTPAPSDTDLLEDIDSSFDICDRWHKGLWAQQLERDHPTSLFRLILHCIQLDPSSSLHAEYEALVAAPNFQAALRRLTNHHIDDCLEELDGCLQFASSDAITKLRHIFLSILEQPNELQATTGTTSEQGDQPGWSIDVRIAVTDRLLKDVDANSLSPSQVLMRLVTTPDHRISIEELAETFWQVATRAVAGDNCLTSELIFKIDPRLRRSLRFRAKRALLFSLEARGDLDLESSQEWPVRPSVLGKVISATRPQPPQDDDFNLYQLILQHLSDISQAVRSSVPDNPVYFDWVKAMLCTSLVYEHAFKSEADLMRLMHSLCHIVSSETFHQHTEIIDLAHDTACFFVSRLTEQAMQCLRLDLGSLAEDARIQTILGEPLDTQPEEPARAFLSNSSTANTMKKWEQLLDPLPADIKISYDLLDISNTS